MEQSTLFRFFSRSTSMEEEEHIKEWLESSAENKSRFLRERKLYNAILLSAELDNYRIEEKEPPILSIARRALKVAAIAALFVGISYLYNRYEASIDDKEYYSLSVPAGQRMNLILPDGTDIWLNACTKIRYPQSFNKKKRHVILDGEAYFNVKKDKKKPFLVQTKQHNIEVLGTEFNVNAYSSDDTFETILFSGEVKISSLRHPQEEIRLQPNTKAYLHDGKLATAEVDYADHPAWKENLISFRNTPFDEVMKDFERYFDIRIQVRSEEVKKASFTGKFRQSDGLEYALKVLQKNISFTYKRDQDKNTIYIE